MERRNFLTRSGLFIAMGALSGYSGFASLTSPDPGHIDPVLLPPLPPLDPKGGMDIRVWVRSAMTNGVYSNVECAVAPKRMGPPPHYHKELDELMFVLEGNASVLIGEEVVQVQAGGWHLRPRMIKHTFWNASDQPLRFVDMYFNQPFEDYLEKIFHQLTPENGWVEGSDAKNQEIDSLNKKFGLIFPPDSFGQRQEIMRNFGLQ
jgi:mannose-6-phosphate isomerase-like protein (cupin superfamily)